MVKILILGVSVVFLSLLSGFGYENKKEALSNIQPEKTFKAHDTTTPMIAPRAIAYTNNSNVKIIKVALYQLVYFDAKSSYDPDGNDLNLSYQWIDTNSQKTNNKRSFVRKYDKKGLYETTLIVKDEQNLTTIDKVYVLVDMNEKDIPLISKTM